MECILSSRANLHHAEVSEEVQSLLGCSAVTLKLIDVSRVRTVSIIRVMKEAVSISETSVNFNVTTRRYIP
jgi:hypothetical protein